MYLRHQLVLGLALAAILCRGRAGAEWRDNPDNNTLWIEDGTDIQTAPSQDASHWANTYLDVTAGESGGFSLCSPDNNHSGTAHGIAVDPAYPYLVWEIVLTKPTEGYQAFGVDLLDKGSTIFSLVGPLRPGIYSFQPLAALPDLKPHKTTLRISIYNNTVNFTSIQMVRKPEQFLELASPSFAGKQRLDPGDPLTFNLTLTEPADDVVVSYYKRDMYYFGHVLTIGGKLHCWLNPTDGSDRKIWSNTIPFVNCVNGAWNKEEMIPFPPGFFLVEAVVKRKGKPDQTFWTCNSYEFK
ncbi:MAG: hypothetical protein IT440_14570 [Phycisphaeraceae bacterium]|nr:hypothetical protein [Phycisphaeraceae bacterium]